jgi:16S rRNA pseudouridine516 synthase
MPAKFIDLGNNEAYIIIKEGKYHQVKRMMNSVGCEVTYLKRVEFGPIQLDETLNEGEYRPLTKEELDLIINI